MRTGQVWQVTMKACTLHRPHSSSSSSPLEKQIAPFNKFWDFICERLLTLVPIWLGATWSTHGTLHLTWNKSWSTYMHQLHKSHFIWSDVTPGLGRDVGGCLAPLWGRCDLQRSFLVLEIYEKAVDNWSLWCKIYNSECKLLGNHGASKKCLLVCNTNEFTEVSWKIVPQKKFKKYQDIIFPQQETRENMFSFVQQ